MIENKDLQLYRSLKKGQIKVLICPFILFFNSKAIAFYFSFVNALEFLSKNTY